MFGYYHPQILPHPYSRRFTPGREVPGPLAIGCTLAELTDALHQARRPNVLRGPSTQAKRKLSASGTWAPGGKPPCRATGEEGARSESAGGLDHGGGSPLGPEPEPEPIAQPRQLPITRLPPIPPVLFPKTRSHCAAQMWCSFCHSLEDRKGTRISS